MDSELCPKTDPRFEMCYNGNVVEVASACCPLVGGLAGGCGSHQLAGPGYKRRSYWPLEKLALLVQRSCAEQPEPEALAGWVWKQGEVGCGRLGGRKG